MKRQMWKVKVQEASQDTIKGEKSTLTDWTTAAMGA